MTGQTKTCIKCGRELPLEDFCKDDRARNGRRNTCYACYNDLRKTYPRYNNKAKGRR